MNIQIIKQIAKKFKSGDVITSVNVSEATGKDVNMCGAALRDIVDLGAAKKMDKVGRVVYFKITGNVQSALDGYLNSRVVQKPESRKKSEESCTAFNPRILAMFNELLAGARA